eukprot:COSAG02_NODE_11658_length_1679_cov_2.331646_3_plen_175_part_00
MIRRRVRDGGIWRLDSLGAGILDRTQSSFRIDSRACTGRYLRKCIDRGINLTRAAEELMLAMMAAYCALQRSTPLEMGLRTSSAPLLHACSGLAHASARQRRRGGAYRVLVLMCARSSSRSSTWACSRLRRRIGGSSHLPDGFISSIHLLTPLFDMRGQFVDAGEGVVASGGAS